MMNVMLQCFSIFAIDKFLQGVIMKNKILFGALTAALIGSVSITFAAQGAPATNAGQVYAGVNAGYMSTPWRDTIGGDANGPARFTDWKNGNGGFGLGAYVGYMLQPSFGVEVGVEHAPTVKTTVKVDGIPFPESVIKNNAFYAAVKLIHKVGLNNTNLFAKAGIGYQNLNVQNGGGKMNSADTFGFYGAMGLDYAVTSQIHIDGSVSYLTGYAKHSVHKFTTDLVYYNVSVGYYF